MNIKEFEDSANGIHWLQESHISKEQLQKWYDETMQIGNVSNTNNALTHEMAKEIRDGFSITKTQDFLAQSSDTLTSLQKNPFTIKDAARYKRVINIATDYLSEMED